MQEANIKTRTRTPKRCTCGCDDPTITVANARGIRRPVMRSVHKEPAETDEDPIIITNESPPFPKPKKRKGRSRMKSESVQTPPELCETEPTIQVKLSDAEFVSKVVYDGVTCTICFEVFLQLRQRNSLRSQFLCRLYLPLDEELQGMSLLSSRDERLGPGSYDQQHG